MFDVPKKETAEKIVRIVQRPLKKGANTIYNIRAFEPIKVNLMDKIKSGPVNPLFYKFFVKSKAFYATDDCIGCKKCEKACVMNNITIKEGKPVWGKSCTHCMACICGCPKEAIEYGKRSKGKPRYQCQKFEAK